MKKELKSCPFCGKQTKAHYTGDIVEYEGTGKCFKNENENQCENVKEVGRRQCWEVRCGFHACSMGNTEEEAIITWNCRTKESADNAK